MPVVFRSIELKAVAAINVLLYSGGEELQIRGPIQISLPLGHSTHLRASDTVPAWAFNLKTGKNIDAQLRLGTRVTQANEIRDMRYNRNKTTPTGNYKDMLTS